MMDAYRDLVMAIFQQGKSLNSLEKLPCSEGFDQLRVVVDCATQLGISRPPEDLQPQLLVRYSPPQDGLLPSYYLRAFNAEGRAARNNSPGDGIATASGGGEASTGWKKLFFGSFLLNDFFPLQRAEANCYL